MRRTPYIVIPILPLAIGALFACESADDTAPNPSADGGTFDSPPSSPLDSAPPATSAVTITVHGNDGPRSGVLVVFHDESGAVLETKTTGADGKATSSDATPAMASALLTRNTERTIVTWTALEAGDELAVNDLDFFTDRGSYDVSLPGLFTGAVRYGVRVGDCAANAPPWTGQTARNVPLQTRCVRAQNAVLVDALDGSGDVLAHAFVKNVAAPGATPSAVPVGAFAAPTDVAVAMTNGPTDANTGLELTEIVGDVGYQSGSGLGDSLTFRTATGFADAMQATAYAHSSGTTRSLSRRVAAPVPANTISFDFGSALPLVTDGTTDVTDARRPSMTWTTEAPTASADGGLVRFMQYLGGDMQLVWTFVVPAGATSVKAPALPAEADAWLPSPDASVNNPFLNVIFVESDVIPDYATFRRQQGTLFRSSAFDSIPVMPANGTISISRWGNDG